ncbi:hypothetical protein T492DRAFT_1122029 [Pavlovales sp. CCMP2436]|nr:hypothetical protein T492DRAFT_1122029 [Pavlovales sp. CCMP2436]
MIQTVRTDSIPPSAPQLRRPPTNSVCPRLTRPVPRWFTAYEALLSHRVNPYSHLGTHLALLRLADLLEIGVLSCPWRSRASPAHAWPLGLAPTCRRCRSVDLSNALDHFCTYCKPRYCFSEMGRVQQMRGGKATSAAHTYSAIWDACSRCEAAKRRALRTHSRRRAASTELIGPSRGMAPLSVHTWTRTRPARTPAGGGGGHLPLLSTAASAELFKEERESTAAQAAGLEHSRLQCAEAAMADSAQRSDAEKQSRAQLGKALDVYGNSLVPGLAAAHDADEAKFSACDVEVLSCGTLHLSREFFEGAMRGEPPPGLLGQGQYAAALALVIHFKLTAKQEWSFAVRKLSKGR